MRHFQKTLWLWVTAFFLALVPAEIDAATLHVFFVAGQSNSDSHAPSSALPSQYQNPLNNVLLFYGRNATTTAYTTLRPGASNFGVANLNNPSLGPSFGPEIGFGWAANNWLSTNASGDKIAIIKYALGGTSLSNNWKGGGSSTTSNDGNIYQVFQSVANAGLTALNNDATLAGYDISLSGMLWTQGEADITGTDAPLYGGRLVNFINDVRLTYGSDLPFYISKISDNQTAYTPALRDQVRAGQQHAADTLADVYTIDTDGAEFSIQDSQHFNAAGELALGTAFANTVIATGAIPEPSTYAMLGVGLLSLWALRRKKLKS